MRRCIIHVGMHKTGTTTIQAYLFRHLRSEGFVYADLCGDANHSSRMFSLFSARSGSYHLHRKRGWQATDISSYNEETKRSLLATIHNSGKADLIISGEDISDIEEQGLVSLKSFLSQHFSSITIAAYVRPPWSYMDSDFQQKAKSGRMQVAAENHYPNYQRRFGKFDRVFGRGNVLLWKFDSASLVDQCVVSDFGQKLGIPVDASKVVRTNESLSKGALALLSLHQRFGPGVRYGTDALHANHRLIAALAKIGGAKPRLAPAVVAPVLAAHQEDIAWMEARLGVSLEEPAREGTDQDIRSVEDLLKVDPATVDKLKEMIGPALLPAGGDDSAERIAVLVEILRTKLTRPRMDMRNKAAEPDASPKRVLQATTITPADVVRLVTKANPELLGNLAPERAQAIIGQALVQLAKQLDAVEEGAVQVPGLGTFEVAQVGRETGGRSVRAKRTLFRSMLSTGVAQ